MNTLPGIQRPPEPEAVLQDILQAPVLTRLLYPRGGFEGLEPNAVQVLAALQEGGERTVTQLVARLVLSQSTVSTALARLQERALVEERVDANDRRLRRQAITPAGRDLVSRFSDAAAARLRSAGAESR